MAAKPTTKDRILHAFLDLVNEHGYEGSTTRAVADAAGVNEVTLFRHFGDKASLARAAVMAISANAALAGYEPSIDTSDPAKAAADLCTCLIFLRDTMRNQPFMINPVLRELARRLGRGLDKDAGPGPVFSIIQRALLKARPVLRPEVDITAATLSLLGLTEVCVMEERYSHNLDIAKGDALFAAALRPLIRWNADA
jgi:AcrR family transcriptional regulator